MAIVVVGGQTRNIGKTSVVAGLIRALPEMQWTAFKITHHWHGRELADGGREEPTLAIQEEQAAASGTDSARYLEAGAVRSFWVRTRQRQLAEAMPRLRQEFAQAQAANQNVI